MEVNSKGNIINVQGNLEEILFCKTQIQQTS